MIEHLRGRERKLEPLGWTGSERFSPQYRWPRSQWRQIQNTTPQPAPRQIR